MKNPAGSKEASRLAQRFRQPWVTTWCTIGTFLLGVWCFEGSAIAGPIRLGFIGDSITDEYPSNEHGGPPNFDRSWIEIHQDLHGDLIHFNNQAMDGAQTFDAINRGQHTRIRDAVSAGELDVVGIAIGVNNIAFGNLIGLFTLSTTPESVADRILADIVTISDTVESSSKRVPMFIATVPDFMQTTFVRDLAANLQIAAQGGQPSPFFQVLLQLAPASFRNLIQSGLGEAAIDAGFQNLHNAVLETNLRIQQLAAERDYGYVDLYGVLNQYGSGDLILGETVIPQDFLYSQHDFWHGSSILGALAANIAMVATAKAGFDTQSLILSDQEILQYWNDRASITFPITGTETYVIDSESMRALTTNPIVVPEASTLAMLTSALLAFGLRRVVRFTK